MAGAGGPAGVTGAGGGAGAAPWVSRTSPPSATGVGISTYSRRVPTSASRSWWLLIFATRKRSTVWPTVTTT